MLQISLFLLAIFSAFTIQSVAGFGGPLISMPIGIALLGVGAVKPAITFCAWLSSTLVALPNWRGINRPEWLKMSGVMLVFLAAGLWLFKSVTLSFLQVIYGLVVMAIGAKKLLIPVQGTPPRWMMYLCIGLAGIMQGLFVSGGSFLVVYALYAMEEKQELRVTLSAVWSTINTFLLLSYLIDGSFTGISLTMTAYTILPTVLAVWLGSRLAGKLDKDTFVKLAYILLIVSGGILFFTSIF